MERQQKITDILAQALSPVHLEVVNESHMHSVPENSETHFKVLVVSEKFAGKSRVDRQREISALLKSELESGLHALAQRALTPEEWEKSKSDFRSPDCKGGSSQ